MNKGKTFHSMSLEERLLDILHLGSLQVGRLAEGLQKEIKPYEKEGFDSPEGAALTVADLISQDILLYLIKHFIPEIAIDAEEDTELVSAFSTPSSGQPFIVIDPIDGTLNYSRGSNEYAVMAALIKDDLLSVSLVYLPAHRKMFWAQRGRGAWGKTDDNEPYPLSIDSSNSYILIPPHIKEPTKQKLIDADIDFSVSRCSGIDAIAPAAGLGKASISERRLDRRRCIGFLITLEAGGCVLIGDELWKGQDPLLLPDDHGPIIVAGSYQYAGYLQQILAK